MAPFCPADGSFSILDQSSASLDFSLCFQHVVMHNLPSLLLLVSGLPRLAFLVRRDARFSPSAAAYLQIAVALASGVAAVLIALKAVNFDTSLFLAAVLAAVSIAISIPVAYLESVKLPAPSSLLSLFWALQCVTSLISLRSYDRTGYPSADDSAALFAYTIAFTTLSGIGAILNALPTGRAADNELPELTASIWSRMTFTWMFPLLIKSNKMTITTDDVYDAHKRLRVERLLPLVEDLEGFKGPNSTWHFVWVVLKSYWVYFIMDLACTILSLVATFVTPICLNGLITYVTLYSRASQLEAAGIKVILPPVSDGIYYAIGMFLATNIQAVASGYGAQLMMELQMKLKTMLTTAIYRKSLVMSLSERKDSSIGEVVNRMNVDTDQFIRVILAVNQLWSAPFSIAFALYFLVDLLGGSAFAGLGIVVILAPCFAVFATVFQRLMKEKMATMDLRIKLLSEVISGMKSVKLFRLEEFFTKRIVALREKEQGALQKLWTVLSFIIGILNSITYLITILTLGVYALVGPADKPLDAARVFVSMSYLNILLMPLASMMGILSMIFTALVSFRRISQFLHGEEIDPTTVTRSDSADASIAVDVAAAAFKWAVKPPNPEEEKKKADEEQKKKADEEKKSKKEAQKKAKSKTAAAAADETADDKAASAVVLVDESSATPSAADGEADATPEADAVPFELTDINVQVPRGSLVAITGRVGTGKTMLLHGILGELLKPTGSVTVNGSIAYVPQQPWIVNGTMRDNIILGNEYDERKYNRVILACALLPDLEVLTDGDMTLIGDKGVNLSGGQKARVSLARAVYSDHDVYLLDDCLSAVDAHVDKHIFTHVLGPDGLLRHKTVVLVTHGVHHLSQCDRAVLLKDNTVAEQGTYEELMSSKGLMYTLVTDYSVKKTEGEGSDTESGGEGQTTTAGRGAPKRGMTKDSLHASSGAVVADDKTPAAAVAPVLDDDESKSGSILWSVYTAYFKATKTNAFIAPVLLLFSVAAMALTSWWPAHMTDDAEKRRLAGETVTWGGYFAVYIGLTVFSMFSLGVLCIVTMAYMSVRASRNLHAVLIKRVMHAPMRWFDVTPAGRITSRFSGDIEKVDLGVPQEVLNAIFSVAAVISTLALLGLSAPWTLVLVPFACVYLYYVQRFYLNSSRELQRMTSATSSPIYQKFEETLHGIVSVRAYGLQSFLQGEIVAAINRNTRVAYLSRSLERWLSVSTNLLASFFILGAGLAAVVTRSSSTGAFIGLALTQAQSLIMQFNLLAQRLCSLETQFVAVERILQYSEVEQEAAIENDFVTPPEWPARGAVTFEGYTTAYRPELEPVLKQVTLNITPGHRVGIVGRTGSGKSTTTLALFRIIEALEGKILIDGVDIAQLGLGQLRSNLCIIPQDPMLFAGTIRDQLDPHNQFDDAAVWRALAHANMEDHVGGLDGKLQAEVTNGGANFSAGQKQLLTLAAAILRKRKIVIFDEATSSTDAETDAIVQRTIRQEFADCTILTIAHRINTIQDS
ncbi:hypothetical protein BC828DRAFT_391293, partial [Blastocladiella britannica]